MPLGLPAEPLSLNHSLQHSVIENRSQDSALLQILHPLSFRYPLLADDELVQKESLRHRESDGRAIQTSLLGKVNQDVDEGK
jgi:hypothetical protein